MLDKAEADDKPFKASMLLASPLSPSNERLVMRWFDGELGRFGAWRANRLLSRSDAARNFLQDLDRSRSVSREWHRSRQEELGANLQSNSLGQQSLWDAVLRRIDVEERSSLYLGPRKETTESGDERDAAAGWSTSWVERCGWGVCGALSTAVLALVLRDFPIDGSLSNKISGLLPAKQNLAGNGVGPVASQEAISSLARTSAEPSNAAIVPVSGVPISGVRSGSGTSNLRRGRGVEVDWMRSDGTLQLIQGSELNSTLIWVKRDRSRVQAVARPRAATPQFIATKIAAE